MGRIGRVGCGCPRYGGVESEGVLDGLESVPLSGICSSVGAGGGTRWCGMRHGGIHVVYEIE